MENINELRGSCASDARRKNSLTNSWPCLMFVDEIPVLLSVASDKRWCAFVPCEATSFWKMKFIADNMLGRLAKWLRIMGYDTAYSSSISDGELLQRAAAEKRIILTRNHRLVTRAASCRLILVRYDNIWEQLRQVVRELNLNLREHVMTRCSVCNCKLVSVDRESIEGKVADYIFQTQQEFSRCPQCGRIYWKGSHYQRIRERLCWIRGE